MKIRFKVLDTKEDLPKITVKTNKKYIHEFQHQFVFYKMINCLSAKSIVVIGSLNDKDYFWCTTIPFTFLYDKYPLLKSEANKFNNKGFHKRILEAICTNHVEPAVRNITSDNFMEFITPKEEIEDAKPTEQS